MTVSPKWPDEGKNTQFQEENPGIATPVGPPNALPPTLFQLPDLRVKQHQSTGRTEFSDSASTRAGRDFARPVAEMPFATADPSEAEPVAVQGMHTAANAAEPSTSGDDEPRFPMPPAVVDDLATPATAAVNRDSIASYAANNLAPEKKSTDTPPPVDTPAGRSWMDSIGSHGIVVALLLVVVAAALYTGRVGNDDTNDASLADGHDWIEYGTEDEISLPKAALAEGSSKQTDPLSVAAADSKTLNDGASGSAIASDQSQIANNSTTSGVLLSEPVGGNPDPESPSSLVENQATNSNALFQQPHASTIPTVSSAAVRRDQLPTQANLTRQTEQPAAYGISVPADPAPTYQQTSTPSGIADWSKYFPSVPSGNTASPTYPSPSN